MKRLINYGKLNCLEGTECRHWTRSRRRSSGLARRSLASMRSATSSPASSANWKRQNVCSRATPRAPGQQRWPQRRRRRQQRKQLLQRGHAGAGVLRPENQLVAGAARRPWGIRSSPWQPARRSRKSLPHARELARTMLASSSPGTSGLAASKSATGNSTPHSLPGRSNAPRSEPGKNGGREGSGIGDELNWPFKSDIREVADAGGVGVIAVAKYGDVDHVRRRRILPDFRIDAGKV